MKHATLALVGLLCLGCNKSTTSASSASVALTPAVELATDGEPVVVVGDPTHQPGRFGGPCKDENCGHERCIAARKFISDAHPCVVCEKPIVWGDDIVVFFTGGQTAKSAGGGGRTDSEAKWQERLTQIDVIAHEKCRETTKCVICDYPLAVGNQKFHSHDGKVSHDKCYEVQQDTLKETSTQ